MGPTNLSTSSKFFWVVGLVNACVKKIKLVTHMFFKPKLFKLTVLCSTNVMKFNQGQFKWAQQICPQVLNFLGCGFGQCMCEKN